MKRHATKTQSKKCATKHCRKHVGKKQRQSLCPKCAARRFRERNPFKYFYGKLKFRAKERKKIFTLTLEEFIHFYKKHNLLDERGKFKGCMSIDRRCPMRGYEAWNIQPLELGENARKQHVPYFKQLKEAGMSINNDPVAEPFKPDHFDWRAFKDESPNERVTHVEVRASMNSKNTYPVAVGTWNRRDYPFWRYIKI
jgi:hypothetical protein